MKNTLKKTTLLCAITLDTEPDCDIRWHLTNPLSFKSVTRLIPELYRPLWQRYGIRPTYFSSPSVLRDEDSVAVLQAELKSGAEIGAHLHPEYIEPVRKYSDPAGTVSDEFPCNAYPYEVELEKIKNLTTLITERIGRRPVSYRAGRFGADQDTIRALHQLGYQVDSSVTPFIDWTKKGGPDHSNAPLQPYYIAPKEYYEMSSSADAVLEIPITIFGKRLGPFGSLLPNNWLAYNWLRPSHMSFGEQKLLIHKIIKTFGDQPVIVFTMMFHSMEPLTKSTPFVRTNFEKRLYINRLVRTIEYLKKIGCQFITTREIASFYRQHQIVPEQSILKRGLKFNNYQRYKNIGAKQYNKRNFLTYFFWRKPSDRVLLPLVKSIHGKKILDVGCGTGCYTNFLANQNNQVIGVDKNIHLAAGLSFPVIDAGADDFKNKIPGKYDLVFSSWLTDYLGADELRAFFKNSHAVLEPDGKLIFTAISPLGWGGAYIWLARHIRRIKKYCYQPNIIRKWLDQENFSDIKIVPLNSWLKIPWAYIVKAKKASSDQIKTSGQSERKIKKIGLMARGLTRGGVTRFINNILREFDRFDTKQYQFVLFVDQKCYKYKFNNIKVIYRKSFNRLVWEYFQILPDIWREKCDYLIYPKNTTPLTHYLFTFKKIVIVHDLAYFNNDFLEYKLLDTIFLKLATPIACRKADAILTVSEFTKQEAIKIMNVNPSKISVIHEAVEGIFQKSISPVRRSEILHKYNIKKPFFFYCGTLSPRKNALRLLQAFNQIKNTIPHDIYITAGESWHDKDVRRFIREKLADRVKLLGYITEEELMSLYQEASAFLYPSLIEGFGLPILEAQACGCPVLTSNASSCPEVAGSGAHIVNPYSINEIKRGIIKITSDTNYRQKLIEEGNKNIQRFSWDKVAKKILEAI